MKTYITEDRLRLVGKAWEVRRSLQQLLRHTNQGHLSLQELLVRMNRRK